MNTNRRWWPVLVLALQGCANVVVLGHTVHEVTPQAPNPATTTEASSPAAPRPSAPVDESAHRDRTVVPVRAVTVGFETPALERDARAAGFDVDVLLTVLRTTLASRGLLVASEGADAGAASVRLTGFDTQSTSNAVVFGRRLGAGALSAVVEVGGMTLKPFAIDATAQLRTAAGAANDGRYPLDPLYRNLADRLADQLAGTPGRSVATRSDVPP